MTAPLHRLTLAKEHFVWDEGADKAFAELKRCFSAGPILTEPNNTMWRWIRLSLGWGLFWLGVRSITKSIPPRMSPAERNYDIVD